MKRPSEVLFLNSLTFWYFFFFFLVYLITEGVQPSDHLNHCVPLQLCLPMLSQCFLTHCCHFTVLSNADFVPFVKSAFWWILFCVLE